MQSRLLSGPCAVSGRSGRPCSRATSRPARGGTDPRRRSCRDRAVAAPGCRRRSWVPSPLLPRPRRRRLTRRCFVRQGFVRRCFVWQGFVRRCFVRRCLSSPSEVSSLRLPSPSRLLPLLSTISQPSPKHPDSGIGTFSPSAKSAASSRERQPETRPLSYPLTQFPRFNL